MSLRYYLLVLDEKQKNDEENIFCDTKISIVIADLLYEGIVCTSPETNRKASLDQRKRE